MMHVGVGSTHTDLGRERDERVTYIDWGTHREKRKGKRALQAGQASRNLVVSRRRRRQRVCVVPSGGDMGLCALLSIFFFSSSFLYPL